LVDADRWQKTSVKLQGLEELRRLASELVFEGVKVSQWLKRPENSSAALPSEIRGYYPPELWETLEIDLKYAGYIARQEAAVTKLRAGERRTIPMDIAYDQIPGLRKEARQKLAAVRPTTLSQAARIPGVTQADLALLSVAID
jgi:tRNA uridine 5-carboxymethylaminomethyl modification enzyme